MGSWYWIGVALGLGTAIGVLVAGAVGAVRTVVLVASVAVALAGAAVGFGIDEWQTGSWADIVAAAAGAVLTHCPPAALLARGAHTCPIGATSSPGLGLLRACDAQLRA